jgi:hypothetical protein
MSAATEMVRCVICRTIEDREPDTKMVRAQTYIEPKMCKVCDMPIRETMPVWMREQHERTTGFFCSCKLEGEQR